MTRISTRLLGPVGLVYVLTCLFVSGLLVYGEYFDNSFLQNNLKYIQAATSGLLLIGTILITVTKFRDENGKLVNYGKSKIPILSTIPIRLLLIIPFLLLIVLNGVIVINRWDLEQKDTKTITGKYRHVQDRVINTDGASGHLSGRQYRSIQGYSFSTTG